MANFTSQMINIAIFPPQWYPAAEARVKSLENVHGKWLDDVKGTLEDPDAVRSRLVATQVNTYSREDVT